MGTSDTTTTTPSTFAENRQNDEGYLQLWQAPQQDARSVQTLRLSLSARPEEDLRQLRIPKRQRQEVQLGRSGQEKKDHGLWPHADAEGCPPQVQERLPGRHTEGREGSGEPGINDGCEMEVGWSKI